MLVIGTRGSKLALAQTEIVVRLLKAADPGLTCDIRIVSSLGDQDKDKPLAELAAQGIFTQTLERALQEGEIDMAIHSAKDLPSTVAPGMMLAAFPPREDARDCLVSAAGLTLSQLPRNARIGTGSPRRMAQLNLSRPDLFVETIRGNVDTRRRAALDGRFDAVVLATAGLLRLDLLDEHVAPLNTESCLPQAGQGAIAVEILASRPALLEIARTIDHAVTRACVQAERATLAGLAAGCQAPVAAYAEPQGQDGIWLRALVATRQGGAIRVETRSTMRDAETLGSQLAQTLRDRGADRALQQWRLQTDH